MPCDELHDFRGSIASARRSATPRDIRSIFALPILPKPRRRLEPSNAALYIAIHSAFPESMQRSRDTARPVATKTGLFERMDHFKCTAVQRFRGAFGECCKSVDNQAKLICIRLRFTSRLTPPAVEGPVNQKPVTSFNFERLQNAPTEM